MQQRKPHRPRPRRPREAARSSADEEAREEEGAGGGRRGGGEGVTVGPAAATHEARSYSRSSQRFQKGLLVRTACGRAASGHLLSPLGLSVVGVSRGPPASSSSEAARGGGRSRQSQRARGEKTGS
jgi:hypothetical protein